jgi:hypothetical protein
MMDVRKHILYDPRWMETDQNCVFVISGVEPSGFADVVLGRFMFNLVKCLNFLEYRMDCVSSFF